MDRGLAVAAFSVLSGWLLILAASLAAGVIVDVISSLEDARDLLPALLKVALGFLSVAAGLYAWERVTLSLVDRIKREKRAL
ncbi:MAG: hypothetical protein DRO06_04690 [Thermoproteota archaeon]|nr:MAG: hypothetical protein DRO06_04690 [Candidatus Korarchaeota archaeon]